MPRTNSTPVDKTDGGSYQADTWIVTEVTMKMEYQVENDLVGFVGEGHKLIVDGNGDFIPVFTKFQISYIELLGDTIVRAGTRELSEQAVANLLSKFSTIQSALDAFGLDALVEDAIAPGSSVIA